MLSYYREVLVLALAIAVVIIILINAKSNYLG